MSPFYDFICTDCGRESMMFYPAQADHTTHCECGVKMRKNFKKMIPAVQYEENDSVDWNLTGEPIRYNSMRSLKEIARKHGCEVAD